MAAISRKYKRLIEMLKGFDSLAVAFSGGIDSTFLAFSAKDAGIDPLVIITVDSALLSAREKDDALFFGKMLDTEHIILDLDIFSIPGILKNQANRCYFCKKASLERIILAARKHGIENIAHGANTDDSRDFRPGLKAAAELGVVSPLAEAGLGKSEIRALAKEKGLSNWNKPSMACLATRFALGSPINREGLKMLEEAEEYLFKLGFSGFRVRMHDRVARIETGQGDLKKIMDEKVRGMIVKRFKLLGFGFVAVDLEGYRTGSMNPPL